MDMSNAEEREVDVEINRGKDGQHEDEDKKCTELVDKSGEDDGENTDAVRLVDYGAARGRGSRPHQEDRCSITPPELLSIDSLHKVAFFGVYDGHGTARVAAHAQKHIHQIISSSKEFQEGNYEAAIRNAIAEEDGRLLKAVITKGKIIKGGSTIAVCLLDLRAGVLVVGNLGHSHVLLGVEGEGKGGGYRGVSLSNLQFQEPLAGLTGREQERLTAQHTPDIPSEVHRVEAAGSRISHESGKPRIGGINITRALGDYRYKSPLNAHIDPAKDEYLTKAISTTQENVSESFISNEPHVRTVQLKSGKRYVLVLGSDGVWNAAGNEKVLGYVEQRRGEKGEEAAGALDVAGGIVGGIARLPGSDNCTCEVVFVDGRDVTEEGK
ncbi:protein serine/threonine phosphatase 2C [Choiromyces venosus 120613-1]|uniref:protein-serine/threonine phosphatase n=1 Tax=Choiromyces venosus 120613-1 TaxID=1336337 RepID=A0A3N4JC77_9PEZI|nr:protein serine/threonine phosphatase 2C [Choiromyces venosus 120613-1]